MKLLRIATAASLTIGLGLSGLAIQMGLSTRAFLATATAVQGEVRALMPERGNNGLLFKPVIAYTDHAGQARAYVSPVASNPPSFQEGEAVALWLAPPPSNEVRLNAFMNLWGGTVVCGLLGGTFALFGGTVMAVGWWRSRRANRLQSEGRQVLARIQAVELDQTFSMNGRHPYRIVCQWQDPRTQALHLFESEPIWFDPSPFLKDEAMPVWINPDQPREHHMDLAGLPRMAA